MSESFCSFADSIESSADSLGDDSSGSTYHIELKGTEKPSSPRTTVNANNSRLRIKRSMSIDSTRSNVSGDSSELRRRGVIQGVGDVGKSMMKMTGLVKSSSSESIDKLAKKKRTPKADISIARLPSDLGLEAGLWMEQQTMSLHSRSHQTPRKGSTGSRGRTSSLGASMHGIHTHNSSGNRTRPLPKRTKSSDAIELLAMKESIHADDAKPESPVRMKRTLSSDDIDLVAEKWEIPTVQLLETSENTASESTIQADSIWSRLEKDNARKQKLRERLNSMNSVDCSGEDYHNTSSIGRPLNMVGTEDEGVANQAEQIVAQYQIPSQRVREYRSEILSRDRGVVDNDTSLEPQKETPRKSNASAPIRPTHSAQPEAYSQVCTMKALNENEADDDDSFDMERLAATARAYGANADHLGASHRSASSNQMEDNLRVALDFEEKAGLRHRDVPGEASSRQDNIDVEDKWTRVMAIVQESSRDKNIHYEMKERMISSGRWLIPTIASMFRSIRKTISSAYKSYKLRMKPPEIIDDLVRDSSYAVVTFTSRQAAVAARHCLADSRGHDRWVTVGEIPSPPLADAPTCNTSSFRGCVRPVTLSISDKQKLIRHTM